MTDLTYRQGEMFTRFMPETKAGELAWNKMQEQEGTVILNIHASNVIQQLRNAGYKVTKVKAYSWDMSIDELLLELQA